VHLNTKQKLELLAPKLASKTRMIRISVAEQLLGQTMPKKWQPIWQQALTELLQSYQLISWRGEGALKMASYFLANHQYFKGVDVLLQSIKQGPYFAASYLQLVQIYQNWSKEDEVNRILTKGLANLPKEAALYYAKGLHAIRTKQFELAIASLTQAHQFDPTNNDFLYTLIVIHIELGQKDRAKQYLDKAPKLQFFEQLRKQL